MGIAEYWIVDYKGAGWSPPHWQSTAADDYGLSVDGWDI